MNLVNYPATRQSYLQKLEENNLALVRVTDAAGRSIIPASDQKLNANCIHTAMALVEIFSKMQFQSQQLYFKNWNSIIKTCLPQLSTKTGYTDRTIQRHICKLTSAGIIKEKFNYKPIPMADGKWRFPRFDILMNTDLIVYSQKLTEKECSEALIAAQAAQLENELVTPLVSTVCPHSDTLKNNSKEGKAVDNTRGVLSEVLAPSATEKTEKETKKAKGAGINHANPPQPVAPGGEDQPGAAGPAELHLQMALALAKMLWQYATQTLYAHFTFFSPQEEKKVVTIFYKILSASKSERGMRKLFNRYLWMMESRNMWQKKQPERERFISQPSKYFDPYNAKGFILAGKYLDLMPENKLDELLSQYPAKFEQLSRRGVALERSKLNAYLRNPSLTGYLTTANYFQKYHSGTGALERFNATVIKIVDTGRRNNNPRAISEIIKIK